MTILAVDTTGPVASVAVSRDGIILYEASANAGLTHSALIAPMIDEAVKVSGVSAGDIDVFACVAGPGSFTGVRIGVCAVKGMAQALDKPCVSLDALEVLAVGKFGFDGVICPILDARRDQVYCAAFEFQSGERPKRLTDGAALALDDFLALLPKDRRLMFVGDGVRVHGESIKSKLGGNCVIAPDCLSNLRAGAACMLAEVSPVTDARNLDPIYYRKPQAERERERAANG